MSTWIGVWLRWTLATAIGWSAGEAVASLVPEDSVLGGALHTAVIGVILGASQWLVLRRSIDVGGQWIVATTAGSAIGGAIGIAASFASGADVIQPWALLPFGIMLGLAQWLVLRTKLAGASWWTVVSTLGLPLSFIVGLVVSFSLGFEWEEVDPFFRVESLSFFGAVAGAVLGILSGALLVALLRNARGDSARAIARVSQA
jgi:hypothetical protein